jgi:putative ABC transport system permease protein
VAVRETMRAALARASELLRRRQIDAERDEEFRFHLESEIEQRIARGETPDDARRNALIAFGGVDRFREETGDARGFVAFESIVRDFRFAARRLRRAPAFTIGTIATLGVGLGVAVGIGALVYGVMLRPLPYANPERIARVSLIAPGLGSSTTEHSSGTYAFLAERLKSFSSVGAYLSNSAVSITEGDQPERVAVALVTPSVLSILGVTPAAGRLVNDEDTKAGFDAPIMISYALWQRRYGGDPAVVGKFIEVNRSKRLIAGVLPRGFAFPYPETAIYYPDRIGAKSADLTNRNLVMLGRLAPGVSVARAQREVDRVLPRLGDRFPEIAGEPVLRAHISGRVETLRDSMISPVRAELRLLVALVAAVLLIAMANVATLALLRAERLRTEVAVIRALGASAAAVRQRFIAESVLASLAGAVAALPVASLIIATKLGIGDARVARLDEIQMTPAVAAVILGLASAIGLAVGAVMSVRASHGAADSLRADARVTGGRGWRRTQELLVSVQIAVAIALLLNAGLFTASMMRLRRVDLGFSPKDAVQFSLQLPFRGYPTYQRTAAFDLGVVDRLARIPGVTEAAAAMELPSTPQLLDMLPTLEARRLDGRTASAIVRLNVASPTYFDVMHIPIRAGRTFAPGDLVSPTIGVVLSAALARDLFGTADPIGREVRFNKGRYLPYRVVGISGDVYDHRVTNGALRSVYFPLLADLDPSSQETENRIPIMPSGMHFIVRSTLSLDALTPAFRATAKSVDPRVPVYNVRTLDDIVAATTASLRLSMLLLGSAAVATLLLGAIGIYSVVAYTLVGRAPELAVRLALGATPRTVTRLVYRENALMIGGGAIAGALVSLAGGRIIRGLLFEVSATDPRLFAASVVAVALVAGAAVYSPARRAGNTDPAAVLRGWR